MFQDPYTPANPSIKTPLGEGTAPIRIAQLRGLRVISLSEVLKMGKVEDVLIDPTAHFVAALRVRGGGSAASEHLVLREAVKRVGQHAVVLGAPLSVGNSGKQPEFDRMIDIKTFIGLEVVTDEGVLLGRIRDAEIDPQTLNILEYELTRNFWDAYLQTGMRVSARHTLSGSKDMLIVPQEALRKGISLAEGIDVPKEW
jgi:uncharacterized protein YrrD